MPMSVGKEHINTDMLIKFMFHRIIANRSCGASQEILKSQLATIGSHTTSAMVLASVRSFASIVYTRARYRGLFLGLPLREKPRRMQ